MSLNHQIIQDSPSAYWPMGEASGTVAADQSGNGRSLSQTNGTVNPGRSVPPLGLGRDFILAGNMAIATATWMDQASFTIEAWMVFDSLSTNPMIAARDRGTTRLFQFYAATNAQLIFAYFDTGNNFQAAVGTAGDIVIVGRLHHIAVTVTGQTAEIFLDGTSRGAGTGAGTRRVSTTVDLAFGDTADTLVTNRRLDGGMAHAAFFPTVLSAARIKAHYQAGILGGVMSG